MKLSEAAEEVASFYAKMLTHDYTTMEAFNKNFMKDWRKVMNSQERELITDLKKCDFKAMNTYFTEKSEERKNRSKEEKKVMCRMCPVPIISACLFTCTRKTIIVLLLSVERKGGK